MYRFVWAALLLAGSTACSSSSDNSTKTGAPRVEVELLSAAGATLSSHDDQMILEVGGTSFAEEKVKVGITTADASVATPVPQATIGSVYDVETTGVPTTTFNAVVRFRVSADDVAARGGAHVLGVAHGKVLGQMWDEVLIGLYDEVTGTYSVQVPSFSYFALIDTVEAERAIAGMNATGDAGTTTDAAGSREECTLGATQVCECASGTGSQACVEGRWDSCECAVVAACTDGATRTCNCASGGVGTETCADGTYDESACEVPEGGCAVHSDCETQEWCANGECVFGEIFCSDNYACADESGTCCDLNVWTCVPVDSAGTECSDY